MFCILDLGWRSGLEYRGRGSLFLLRLAAGSFLHERAVFHIAEHEVLAALLDDSGEGVQQLDAVPLLVVVAAIDQVRLVDRRRLGGLAVLERKLVR